MQTQSNPPTTERAGAVGRGRGGEIPSPGTGGFGDLGLNGGSTRPEAQGLGGFFAPPVNDYDLLPTSNSGAS